MKCQRSPNTWSCLPTAFAIAIGIPVADLIKRVGHDGSENLWPDLPSPYSKRSFHIQEMTYTLFSMGFNVMEFQPIPAHGPHGYRKKPHGLDKKAEFAKILKASYGVLTGFVNRVPHAVAWDGESEMIYDGEATYGSEKYAIESFWRISY